MMRTQSNVTAIRRASPGMAVEQCQWRKRAGGLPWAWKRRARPSAAAWRSCWCLGLISIALAMAYALLRSQSLNVLMQGNGNLRNEARQAALPGLAAGLQKMSQSGWSRRQQHARPARSAAPTATASRSPPAIRISPTQDPNQPYRVTIVSTGYASSSLLQQSQQASYRVRAVVALSPRQLGTQPTDWSTMVQNYALSNQQRLGHARSALPD